MQIDLKNCTFYIYDHANVDSEETDSAYWLIPAKNNNIEIKIGEGNLTFSEKRNIEYTLNKGTLNEVRQGDEVPMDVSFQFVLDYVKGTGTVPTPRDALLRIGAADDWVSTDKDKDTCRPYCVNIQILNEPPTGCGDTEQIDLTDFRVEDLSYDMRAGTVSATGKCNVTMANVTRTAP